MGEIKFRAWHKEKKYMILIFDNTKQKNWFLPNLSQKYEIMQYTGLKDKNRENIYEGDILYWVDKSKLGDGTLSEKVIVFWNKELFRWSVKTRLNKNKFCVSDLSDYSNIEEIEIIGNIYENPELLEE